MVVDRLAQAAPQLRFSILPMTTSGDSIRSPLDFRGGGTGVFVKELETALLRRRIDLAVHSLKDMPTALPRGLKLAAVLERGDPRDVLVSRSPDSLEKLSPGSKIGTSSVRRRAFLGRQFPHLRIQELRGNLDTRLEKLLDPNSDLAGIVVAAAGLERLGTGRAKLHVDPIPVEVLPPAPGQGIVAIETRSEDRRVEALVAAINHAPTLECALAERAVLHRLEGGCNVPIGALAETQGGLIKLTCWLSSLDGTRQVRESLTGSSDDPERLSLALEVLLKSRGAGDIIEEIRVKPISAGRNGTSQARPRQKAANSRRPKKARLARRSR
jgi:hydroxymethylbilane synthase